MTAQPTGTTAEPILLREVADGVVTLTLNRPAARNALSMELMTLLTEELEDIGADPAIKVVVLAGAGPAFCAGHDLKEIRANPGQEIYQALFRQCSRLMLTITRLRQPVIARVHGIATAAGCQLVATCDLAIAADNTRFATPGVNIGLFCSTPMVALSRAVGRKHAMEMLLTGDMIGGGDAVMFGLVNQIVPEADLDATVLGLATQIASKSPLTLAIGKEAFYRQLEMTLDDAYAYASDVMTRNMLARDAEEGIDAFLAKRPPVWEGR
ncbi:enoyl-CoA hydratase [Skermanella stibiiresistens SB22]|uniref:Enoyl-CoA hydratase domain-containing protein 3, mitochondrial n=1 Tax=Skermanella stibiiresistens SB22 TaxID=1385369 RepID=W9H914_9PROT|nr:enoyl-CoA hydratase [Skermanella stibiiresistens]EWY42755.1 enoyl-CoA hydratase [Skermanella stibiiresistens SB22]